MTTSSFQLDVIREANLQLVKAYSVKSTAQKATVENFDGWLERIDELDGLEKTDLVRAHGELIALGYLKFEIAGSSVGLRYKISPAGKQALDRSEQSAAATSNSESDGPTDATWEANATADTLAEQPPAEAA